MEPTQHPDSISVAEMRILVTAAITFDSSAIINAFMKIEKLKCALEEQLSAKAQMQGLSADLYTDQPFTPRSSPSILKREYEPDINTNTDLITRTQSNLTQQLSHAFSQSFLHGGEDNSNNSIDKTHPNISDSQSSDHALSEHLIRQKSVASIMSQLPVKRKRKNGNPVKSDNTEQLPCISSQPYPSTEQTSQLHHRTTTVDQLHHPISAVSQSYNPTQSICEESAPIANTTADSSRLQGGIGDPGVEMLVKPENPPVIDLNIDQSYSDTDFLQPQSSANQTIFRSVPHNTTESQVDHRSSPPVFPVPICTQATQVHSSIKSTLSVSPKKDKKKRSYHRFSNGDDLNTPIPRMRCQRCNDRFPTKQDYQEHLRSGVCAGSKETHVCPICGYCALQKIRLVVHMRTHSGEKPHKCALCTYAAAQIGPLQRHIRNIHIRAGQQYPGYSQLYEIHKTLDQL